VRRSVAVIIESRGKFFVAKRPSGGALGMKWEFPGGKVEEGETDEEAIVREMDEEFGARVLPLRFLGQTEFQHRGIPRELAAWSVELASGARLELREHTECRWIDFGEFADLSLADSDRTLLVFLKDMPL
jgi:8-oxo-dGTP diphosphatase